jgi:hypothetical protein
MPAEGADPALIVHPYRESIEGIDGYEGDKDSLKGEELENVFYHD